MRKSETIAERLIRLRAEMNFTQAQMGQALGVSKNYIYLIESEKNKPGKKLIAKLDFLSDGQSQNLDRTRFALADTTKTAEETTDIRYSVAPAPWKNAPVERLEKLLEECVEDRDYGAVGKVADELLNRKIQEKLK